MQEKLEISDKCEMIRLLEARVLGCCCNLFGSEFWIRETDNTRKWCHYISGVL